MFIKLSKIAFHAGLYTFIVVIIFVKRERSSETINNAA